MTISHGARPHCKVGVRDRVIGNLMGAYIFVAMSPFFVWGKLELPVKLTLLCALLITIAYSIKITKLDAVETAVLALFALFSLYIFAPFRENDTFRIGSIPYALAVYVALAPDHQVQQSTNAIIEIIFIIALGAIISFALYLLGVPFIGIAIDQAFRSSKENFYIVYFFNVILNTQIFYATNGTEMYRISGIFPEPGHFAIYAGFALSLVQRPFSSFRGITIAAALLLTMSPVGFALIFMLMIVRAANLRDYIRVAIFAVVVAICIISSDLIHDIFNRFIYGKISNKAGILDGRTRSTDLWQRMDGFKILFGFGSEILSKTGSRLSDFRGFVVKYGSLAPVLLMLVAIASQLRLRAWGGRRLSLVLVLMLALAHRGWLIESIVFPYFLFVSGRLREDGIEPSLSIRSG